MSEINGLWIGTRLSPLERACVQSFIAKGHRFNLYAYEAIDNVPTGCTLLDAANIVPPSAIFEQGAGAGQGSLAGFSDLFRYRLLYERGGWWADLDMFCLTESLPDSPLVIGRQDARLINGAMLRFPHAHDAMHAAYRECIERGPSIKWAEIGPELLTRYVTEGRIDTAVLPESAFYPLHFTQFWSVLDPRRTAHAAAKIRDSACVHLWNEMIRRNGIDKNVLPPVGSLLRNFYDWTIGTDGFEFEYSLAPSCPCDSLVLELAPRH